MGDTHIKIDCAQIPNIEMQILSHTLLSAIKRFYEDPENRRRFDEWKQKRMEEPTAGKAVQQSFDNGGNYHV